MGASCCHDFPHCQTWQEKFSFKLKFTYRVIKLAASNMRGQIMRFKKTIFSGKTLEDAYAKAIKAGRKTAPDLHVVLSTGTAEVHYYDSQTIWEELKERIKRLFTR
jgi:hypothetical protein